MRKALLLLLAGSLVIGCVDDAEGPDETAAAQATTGDEVPSWYNPSESNAGTPVAEPPKNENCQFDPSKQGKKVGDQVANIVLKDAWGQNYELHQTCGTDKKAIWVVLAAGW